MPVVVPLKGLEKFRKEIVDALAGGSKQQAVRRAFHQIAFIYRSWAKERFTRFSRGGGDWPPLAPSTILGRRKGKAKRLRLSGRRRRTMSVAAGTVSILWDTGTLIGGLDPTLNVAKGAIEEDIPFGVRVGYGGAARHEKYKGTIAQLAAIHQEGVPGRLPARPIIVGPSAEVLADATKVMERALQKTWDKGVA